MASERNQKQAIGYIRVSTAGQAETGQSPEAQEYRIREWARLHDYELLGIENDNGISGKQLKNRPGARRAIDLACEHKAALVFYSLSRLARSTMELYEISERLSKCGADMISLSEPINTSTPEGRVLFGMLAVLAQFERDLTSKRTKEVASYLRASGRRAGEIPFGLRVADGNLLVPDPAEQTTIHRMAQLRSLGTTYGDIADILNFEGARTKKNRDWTADRVRSVLIAQPVALAAEADG